jgi:RNA polymerase sigma-70 factor, ECF subfamily
MKCNVFEIWQEHEKKLRIYIRKRVHNPADTDDILHTVLLKVHRYCEKSSDIRNLNAWLYQVCYHAIADHYKQKARFESLRGNELSETSRVSTDSEARVWIERLLSQLPGKYAEPVRLADIEGLKQQDIADKTSLSLSGAKSRIQRGREKLKSKFEECGIIEKDGERILFTVTKPCCKELIKN